MSGFLERIEVAFREDDLSLLLDCSRVRCEVEIDEEMKWVL